MTTASTQPSAAGQVSGDPLALIDVDHVRFYVGNAKQAAYFYAHTFGFRIDQLADLTTGSRDESDYLLTQGNIRLLLTTPLTKDHPAAEEIKVYGDGVKDIALTVHDATKAYEAAIKNGAISASEPREIKDDKGVVTVASIKTYGRVIHTFVSRTGAYALPDIKRGAEFMPVFKKIDSPVNAYNEQNPCGLKYVDHCVGNVEEGKMN
ncbi:MAG: VOC family protein, partial [Planctomycetota bacterium]